MMEVFLTARKTKKIAFFLLSNSRIPKKSENPHNGKPKKGKNIETKCHRRDRAGERDMNYA
jgi:hypothetical protein